jgi:hypothetical protein
VGGENDLMGLLPKSAVVVSHRPPLWRSSRQRSSCSALLWRSCRRPDMVGQLPAMWPLLVSWPHMGLRRVGLWVRRRVLCTPHIYSCLWVNWVLVSVFFFLWNVKSAPSSVARATRAPCLEVCERCVCMCVCVCVCVCVSGAVCVCVCFDVGVFVGYGLP